MRPVVLCAVLGGCGFESKLAPGSDAASQVDDGADAAFDGAIGSADCLAQWRAGTVKLSNPEPLTSITGGGDDRDPWISRDRLTLYFTSNREVINEIYRAGRTSTADAFDPVVRLVNLTVDTKQQDHPSLTEDEKTLVLSSNRGAGGKFQIFVTTRPDTATDFGSPNQDHLPAVNAGNVDNTDPFISTDGRTLYLTADRGGPSHPKIVVATRLDTSSDFQAPVDVGGVNIGGKATADPALSPDERVIVFSSDRDGGPGNLDLWYAVRADAAQEFAAPVLIPTINSPDDDADPMLSADGCELYFAARHNGDYDLYVSQVAHP
jgi:Tol biopolymer transport system component